MRTISVELRFSQSVRQTGHQTIEVKLPVVDAAIFSEAFAAHLDSVLGINGAAKLMADEEERITRTLVLDGVRTRVMLPRGAEVAVAVEQ
jgi:hypothetical protein